MRCRAALAASLALALLQLGCSSGSSGLPNAPIFNTGVAATIIPPGEAPPGMPGYGYGGASGSYSSQGQGLPGQAAVPQGHPQAGAPATPGYPGTGVPQSAYAPSNSNLSMLGGATTIDTRKIRKGRDPYWSNPLFWPFAVVAYPFKKLGEAAAGDDEEFRRQAQQRITEQTGVAFPESHPYRAHQAQELRERAETEAMERQILEQRGGLPAPGSAERTATGGAQHAAATPGAPRASLSIADELAARRAGAARAPAPSAAAPAAPIPGAAPPDAAEDRDGDGRPDRWVYESAGRRRALVDDDGDGRPEKTVYYAAGGDEIARIDEDSDGDGAPDSWSLYQNGQLSRRRVDTNGDGEPDVWIFYAGGHVVRHEDDTDGDGSRDRIDYFEAGKLARRTEDTNGDGRPDRITRFDDSGKPVELEEDKDGDGQIDVRSHYARGRLVRRELLDAAQATP